MKIILHSVWGAFSLGLLWVACSYQKHNISPITPIAPITPIERVLPRPLEMYHIEVSTFYDACGNEISKYYKLTLKRDTTKVLFIRTHSL